jgi:hypothetical protein
VTTLVDRLVAPAPAERLATLRILVGGYATAWATLRLPEHLDYLSQPVRHWHPSGVWTLLDTPPPDAAIVALALAAPLLGLLFTAGWRFAVTGPAFALTLLGLATLDSSWGQVFHTENLMVLHVGILALAPGAADALALGRSRAGADPDPAPGPAGRYGWPVRLCALVVVITYMTAGVAKLRYSGLSWADGTALRHLVAYDNLRKQLLGDRYSPVGTWLVTHGWTFRPLALATLAVELGAGVALLGRWWRTGWVVAAWLFHVGVLVLMAIVFAYPLTGVAFAPFFPLERLGAAVRPARQKSSTKARSAGVGGSSAQRASNSTAKTRRPMR